MAISITLTTTQKQTAKGTVYLQFLTVGSDVSSKVFAIEVLPTSADTVAPLYRFSHVCSPAELEEFPEDEPGDMCYFRTNNIEMVFDTDELTDKVIANIKADIAKLVKELKALESASGTTETVTFS